MCTDLDNPSLSALSYARLLQPRAKRPIQAIHANCFVWFCQFNPIQSQHHAFCSPRQTAYGGVLRTMIIVVADVAPEDF